MNKYKEGRDIFKKLLLWGMSTVLVVKPYFVYAQGLPDKLRQSLGELGSGGQEQDIGTVVGKVIVAAFGVLGLVFLVIVVYSGFLWATSGGEPEKAKKARGLLINGIIGLAIAFSAYSITRFVVDNIQNSAL